MGEKAEIGKTESRNWQGKGQKAETLKSSGDGGRRNSTHPPSPGLWRTRIRQDATALEKPGFGNSEIGKQGAEFLTANHANGKAGGNVDSLLIFPSGGHFGTNGGKRGANRDPFLHLVIHRVCKALRVWSPILSSMFS
jgi:hypothetical protein